MEISQCTESGAENGKETEASVPWGVGNHTGILTDVLLGKPDHFAWTKLNAISDVVQENLDRLGYHFDKQLAMRQHRGLVEAFEAAGVRCHFLEADEGLKSSVFARDSSFMTPWGAVVASIQTPPRQRDYAVVAEFYKNAGIPIWHWVTAGFFEGGDFVILKPGVALLGYSGSRSTREGAEQVAGWLREEGWQAFVVPIPHQFVHMDACVVMLEKDVALVCEDALPEYALDFIKKEQGIRTINVPYAQCVKLGGNVVNLGGNRVLSMSHNVKINETLKAEGFEVLAVDFDMFALGGGGVHCSCHELQRLPDTE
ncbi:arginine deiminase family protein [Methyloligella sp. 2.7D]|uniref:dimethylarginine dimethylaminohydrolase family protein n=1 Tax=unclassified Methyloligella TaxID=2625955 RepID=UPI00157CAAD1|nr:arginine deiminase family protein [Methyloligella sp. GL2]QKP77922.1 amidinotransferase [Methyloligella sp. GL2]